MKKSFFMATILCCVTILTSCSKSDDDNTNAIGGEIMKIEITNTGKLTDYDESLVIQTVTTGDKVINVEGQDWDDVFINMPAIIFKSKGIVQKKKVLTTTAEVYAVTVAYGLFNQADSEETVNTNIKIYSKDKLIKNYDYVMGKDNSLNSFTIVATHKGEITVGEEVMGK